MEAADAGACDGGGMACIVKDEHDEKKDTTFEVDITGLDEDNKNKEGEDGMEVCRRGDYIAIAPDGDDPFWLARLEEDVDFPYQDKTVIIKWIDPDHRRTVGRGARARSQRHPHDTYHLGRKDTIPAESIICKVDLTITQKDHFMLSKKEKLKILRVDVESDGPKVSWICSHLQSDKILWSSHPSFLPPEIKIDEDLEARRSKLFLASLPADYTWEDEMKAAAKLLKAAPAILLIAGAGMGVDSGLPDYRGPKGFWRAYPPLKGLGVTFEDSHSPKWFERDTHQAWGFYSHTAKLYARTVPHNGFKFLKNLTEDKKDNFFIFTSNIDQQFQKAGFDQKRMYECHGNLGHLQCILPCDNEYLGALDELRREEREEEETKGKEKMETKQNVSMMEIIKEEEGETKDRTSRKRKREKPYTLFNSGEIIWKMDANALPDVDETTLRVPPEVPIPRCPRCGSLGRPNISMAEDTQDTWVGKRSKKQRKRMMSWLRTVLKKGKNESLSDHEDETVNRAPSEKATRRRKKNRNNPKKEEKEEEKEEGEETKQEKEEVDENSYDPDLQLVILELGCGDSLHSIKIEADVLIQSNKHIRLIRINPNYSGNFKDGRHIGIRLGALPALMGIAHFMQT